MRLHIYFLFFLVSLLSCQEDFREPIVPMAEFKLEPGFKINCTAAEPLVDTPVAIDFDEKGRIWAVEMPGYMPNVEGLGEDEANGSIVILEDRDGDGKVDLRKPFLDKLIMPRALLLAYGGLLYCEPPKLWFVEINNDLPGKRTLVDSSYAPGYNPEYQANGLLYGLDNWIYSAGSDKRYRFKNGQWAMEKTAYRSQWGITQDGHGRLFYNSNSVQIIGDQYLPNVMENNPGIAAEHALGQILTENQRVFPIHPTLVNRGYLEHELDSLGRLRNFTSACGPTVYMADQFPTEFYGNAFVCAPEANLLKRNLLSEDGQGRVLGRQAYDDHEFLASNNDTFRPINLKTGPDGCLYVVDMRHGIIQHKAYMSLYLKNEAVKKGLDTVIEKGRIYRICFEKNRVGKTQDLSKLSNKELVNLLANKNGHLRIKAQELLIHKNAFDIQKELLRIINENTNGYEALHALWTMEGLNLLDDEILIKILKTGNNKLIEHTLKILPQISTQNSPVYSNIFYELVNKKNRNLDMNILATLGQVGFMEEEDRYLLMGSLLMRYPVDSLACEAALSGLEGKEDKFQDFLSTIFGQQMDKNQLIFSYLQKSIESRNKEKTNKIELFDHNDMRTAGLKLYSQYCAACHRPGGEGTPNLAPPLLGSAVVNGPQEKLAAVIWHGKSEPVLINGNLVTFKEPMQAFKDNPAWDEKMLEAVVAYVKNAFAEPE